MTPAEFTAFSQQIMAPLYLVFREPPDAALILRYFELLSRYTLADLGAGAEHWQRYGHRFPYPADLGEAASTARAERQAVTPKLSAPFEPMTPETRRALNELYARLGLLPQFSSTRAGRRTTRP